MVKLPAAKENGVLHLQPSPPEAVHHGKPHLSILIMVF